MVGGEPIANEGHSRGGIHTSGNSASDIICRRETSFMRALDGERVIPWCSFEDLVEMYEPDTRREIGNDKVSEWSTYKPNNDNRCKKSQIVIVLSVERNYPQIYGSG